MISNERRSQASTPVVVALDNLKQTEPKGYLLKNKKNKIMSTYLKRLKRTDRSNQKMKNVALCFAIIKINNREKKNVEGLEETEIQLQKTHKCPIFDIYIS